MAEYIFGAAIWPWVFLVFAAYFLFLFAEGEGKFLWFAIAGIFLGFAVVVWHLSRLVGAQ